MALRQVLELGCGALVHPGADRGAEREQAFDEMDNLKDAARRARQLKRVVRAAGRLRTHGAGGWR